MDRSVFKKVVIPSFLTAIFIVGAVLLIECIFPTDNTKSIDWPFLVIAGLIVFVISYFSLKKEKRGENETPDYKKKLRNNILWFFFCLFLAIMCLVGHPTTHDIIIGIIFSLSSIGSACEIIYCYKKIKEQKS